MSAQSIAISPHYQKLVFKQQTITASAVAFTAIAASDNMAKAENIFVQAKSTNSGPITIGNSSVTAGGAGIELAPGANANLPAFTAGFWYAIGTLNDKLNITYQAVAE
jgi:hypothetical protein